MTTLKRIAIVLLLAMIAAMAADAKVLDFAGVPNLPPPQVGHCAPRSMCRVLYYWYYKWGFDNFNNTNLESELAYYMHTDGLGVTPEEYIASGTQDVCDIHYFHDHFTVSQTYGDRGSWKNAFSMIIQEINANRPVGLSVHHHSPIGGRSPHMVTVVGYEGDTSDVNSAMVYYIDPRWENGITGPYRFVPSRDGYPVGDDWVYYPDQAHKLNVYSVVPPGVPATVSNVLIDQDYSENFGTVLVDGVEHQSPYSFNVTPASQPVIGSHSHTLCPADDELHHFISWSDCGDQAHALSAPHWGDNVVVKAYHKKRPVLSGRYDGWYCYLWWDWPVESRPPYFAVFKLYQFGSTTPIYVGTGNSFTHAIGEVPPGGYAGIYYLEAYMYGAAVEMLMSEQCKVSSTPPGGGYAQSPRHNGPMSVETANGPLVFGLAPVTPNPARGSITAAYQVANAGAVSLKVYNRLGQCVRTLVNETKQPGSYQVRWDGRDASGNAVAAGMYFYRLVSGTEADLEKVVIVK